MRVVYGSHLRSAASFKMLKEGVGAVKGEGWAGEVGGEGRALQNCEGGGGGRGGGRRNLGVLGRAICEDDGKKER
jgi:hypothetical protein